MCNTTSTTTIMLRNSWSASKQAMDHLKYWLTKRKMSLKQLKCWSTSVGSWRMGIIFCWLSGEKVSWSETAGLCSTCARTRFVYRSHLSLRYSQDMLYFECSEFELAALKWISDLLEVRRTTITPFRLAARSGFSRQSGIGFHRRNHMCVCHLRICAHLNATDAFLKTLVVLCGPVFPDRE